MNIFVLSECPYQSAIWHNNKHVVKMPLETAQMLSTAVRFYLRDVPDVYKQAYLNHPCTVWARTSKENFLWLCELGITLCEEFSFRRNKIHACLRIILACKSYADKIAWPQEEQTIFALAMPEKLDTNPVLQYRKYYQVEKSHLADWYPREPPYWYNQQ